MGTLVHVAGPLIDAMQRCTRCDSVLIDNRGAMVQLSPNLPFPRGWAAGAFVAVCGGASWTGGDAETDGPPCTQPPEGKP